MPEVSDRASTGNQARSTRASALEQHCTVIKGVGPPPGGGQPSQRELDSQTESAAGLCSVLVAAEGFCAGLSGQRRDASLPPARRTCRLTPDAAQLKERPRPRDVPSFPPPVPTTCSTRRTATAFIAIRRQKKEDGESC
jgi:hypothetical protein